MWTDGGAPPRSAVGRQFEANRMGRDNEARAYQKVLPVVGRSTGKVTGGEACPAAPIDHGLQEAKTTGTIEAKGVAA